MALSTTDIDVYRGTTGVVTPQDVSEQVWQGIRQNSFVMAHANRINLPGTGVKVNIITGDPTPAWVEETHEKTVSEPTFSNKTIVPYKLAVIVPFSNEFRRDEDTLYAAVIDRMPYAMAKMLDQTIFFGTAPGANFDTLTGADAVDLKADPAGAINSAITAIGVAGGTANAIAVSPQGYGILTGAKDDSGSLLFGGYNSTGNPTPFGLPTETVHAAYKAGSSAANTVGFIGDWSKAHIGVVQDLNMTVTDQASLNDGTNTIHLWQRNMFAVRMEMEVGFATESDDFFQRLTDTYPAA